MSTHFLGGERNAKRWRRFEAQARVVAHSTADLESKRELLSTPMVTSDCHEVRDAKQLIDTACFRQP
jgi:hypothetical protein